MTRAIPELTKGAFARALKRSERKRLIEGRIESGEDIVMLRRFVGLSQTKFAEALGIGVHTLRNWEQADVDLRARRAAWCLHGSLQPKTLV